jgi:hypothetical protein
VTIASLPVIDGRGWREEIAAIGERCKAHADERRELDTWTKSVDRDLARIKLIGILALALAGGVGVGLKWIVQSAVTDALIDRGVVRLEVQR